MPFVKSRFLKQKSKNLWVAIFVISGWVVEFDYKCPFNTGWQQ